MDVVQEVKTVEEELLDLIIAHLKDNRMEPTEAQALAKDFLAILPVSSQEDLLKKLKALGDNYDEAHVLYVKEFGKAQEVKEETALNTMRDAIKQGNIEHAIATAKAVQQGN